jgi:hypothetical protein
MRTRKVAKDTVDGYVGELEKGKKRVADIATKQTPPPPPPITPKPTGKDGYTGLGDVVRAKASGLFGTLKDKALGKVSSVLNRGREEAEKEHALAIERQQTAHELLKATDAEYAELDRRKQALVVKVNLTDAEQKEYQQLVALTSDKRNALSQDIAQNGIESDNIRQRIELAQQRGQAIDLEDVANLKQEKSNSRLAKLGNASGKMSGILMTASMVTGAMSMAGGQMGQLAQSIMPVISGMTMLQMVMQGMSLKGQLAAIGLAGIAVAAYGIFQFKNTVGAATDKMLDFNDSLGASAKAIQGLAEFSGKVTSSEVLDKRRQDQLNPYQIVTGKTTFGQNFVKSDTGTAMLKAIAGTSGSSDNFASAGTNLTSELATAVLSNAITAAQARSIAVNIGKKMGNVGIGIKVAGELSSLLGPNGENVLKDGLNIRIKLMQDTRNQVASANNSLNANGSMTGTESMNAWGSALGYGIAGGVASGLAVGTAVAAAGGSEIPVIGWIATAVATIGAGIYGFATASTTYAERIGKLAGAAVALQANALTQQKQLIDSLQMDYEKRIANAKAAGNVAEAERLQNEYLKQRQVLLQQNAKTMTEIQQGFKNSQHQDDLLSGMDKAITKKYKGTAMEDIAAGALSNLQTIQDKNKRYTLELLLNSTVDPMSMMFLTDLMAKDSSVIDKSINISTHLGGTGLNNVLGVAGLFTDANGKPNTKVQTDFIAKMSVVKDGGQADKLIQLYGELGKTNASDVSTTFMVKTVMADPALEARMAQDIEDIKSLPNGTLSYTIVQNAKIIDPKSLDIIKQDQDYFNHIKTNTEQRIYLEYAVMLSGTLTIDDPNFKAWLESEGSAWKDKPPLEALKQYEIYLTHQMTNRAMASGDNAFVSNKNTGTGTGPSASWLDDYVKAIRDLTDGSQKLTIGYDASSKALEKFAGKASSFKNAFKGMSNNLYASNISQDIIDNILGMPKDEADAQMKRFFDKNGKITKFLKDLQQTDAIQKVGNYYTSGLKANRNINDRVAAMGALARVNQNAGLAAEMMADADAVAALSSSKLVGSLADQKKAAEEVTKAFLKKAAEQRLSNSAEQNAINDAQANISVLEAQSAIYQNGLDIISAKAQKITDAYDKQIQALQDVKTVNDQITKQKQSQLDIADALSRGDIGAAAKAAEALRAQKAQDAADAQVKALEDAKKRAVDSLTVEINGQKMTKIELDQKVYDINLNVLNLKKDEVLQNELIIQKQKLQFANLVAQFAQTLKINAEKSKPVTQIQTIRVNRIVTTTNAGGGPTPPPGDTGQTPTPGQITPSGAVTTAELSKGVAAFQRRQTGTTGNRFITGGASNQSAQSLSIDVVKALYNKQKTAFSNGFDLWTNSNTITDLAKRNKFQSELAAFKNTQEYKEAHALGLDTASWKDSYLSQNIQVMSTTAEAFSKVANAATNYGYSILPASIKTRIDWLIQAAQDFNTDKTNYDTLRAKVQGAKDKVGAGSIPITTLYSEYAKAKDADKPKTAFGQMISKSLLTQEDVQAFMDAWNKIKNTAALSFQYKKDLVSRGYDSSTGTLHQFFSDHGVYLPSDIASRNREEIGYHAGVFNPEWVQRYAKGGVVKPKYFSVGNLAVGTDTVPAMLTPGEFVVNQAAVKNFGTDNLKAINSGTYSGDSVYNYSVNVNVANTGANPNDIARTVIAEIKRIDGQRVRGNSL